MGENRKGYIILALISVVVIAILGLIGDQLKDTFDKVLKSLQGANAKPQ